MRCYAILIFTLVLGLCGCSKSSSLISQANGSKQMHAKWKLEVNGVMGHKQPYDVELWVDGKQFRYHRVYKTGANMESGLPEMSEDEVLYDGTDAFLFHQRSYVGDKPPTDAKFPNDAAKMPAPAADSLQLLTFWKVPDFPYDLTGTEKVDGHECQVLSTTQMDIMRQEMKILCYIDASDGLMRQRLERSGADSKDALYSTKYALLEVEMKPTFPANCFKLPADVTDVQVKGPIMKIW